MLLAQVDPETSAMCPGCTRILQCQMSQASDTQVEYQGQCNKCKLSISIFIKEVTNEHVSDPKA